MPILHCKLISVVHEIDHNLSTMNIKAGNGPALYFYRRAYASRKALPSISDFVHDKYSLELMYATLVAWGMNSRGAKMKSFPDFRANLHSALPDLMAVEVATKTFTSTNRHGTLHALSIVFPRLNIMNTGSTFISASKCLHFLFPNYCLPMDGKYTLKKLYGHMGCQTVRRYLEVTSFAYDALDASRKPVSRHIDTQWNSCPMKMVDNAIILMP